ncbi:MAG: beta-lactamase family protein [Chloroflexi bacterium]|nr:MAG: beta-lactamase family protein [Chloroflexota bacterium]
MPGQLGYRHLSPGQLSYPQAGRSLHRYVKGMSVLVIVSLLLVLILELVIHLNHQSQQLIHATPAALSPQDALMASQVNNLLMTEVTHQQFSGSVLIAHNDQVLLSKGYSMADWSKQVPNTPHTRFYLGSTTKQFTAMAILILQEQKKLHVHDQICSYIAPCPHSWQQVTIHELLTHTSGIPEFDHASLSNASPQSWINNFNNVPLGFAPGSEFSYCNVCYQILGYVVEKVSGEPYCTFLKQTIFDPLQMKQTGCDPPYLSRPDHAVGYASWHIQDVSIGWDAAPQWSFLFGAGLLYSTVEDLYRWDQTLSRHTLISRHVSDEAFTPYVTSQYAGSSYGYGWFIAKAPIAGHRLIWHDGRVDGFRTYNGLYPDDRMTIMFLSNLSTLDELALASTLEQIIFAHFKST